MHRLHGGPMVWNSLEKKGKQPLEFIDRGCQVHEPSEVIITASAAGTIIEIIRNLHREGESPTYICQCGHTHRLTLKGAKGCQGETGKRRPTLRNLSQARGV